MSGYSWILRVGKKSHCCRWSGQAGQSWNIALLNPLVQAKVKGGSRPWSPMMCRYCLCILCICIILLIWYIWSIICIWYEDVYIWYIIYNPSKRPYRLVLGVVILLIMVISPHFHGPTKKPSFSFLVFQNHWQPYLVNNFWVWNPQIRPRPRLETPGFHKAGSKLTFRFSSQLYDWTSIPWRNHGTFPVYLPTWTVGTSLVIAEHSLNTPLIWSWDVTCGPQ